MKIQIGANDNQTISIGLQQIDSTTLNLKGFTVSGMADFSAAKLTAADGTAIAAADVKDAGVNKSIYCLTLTPRLTVLNMRSLILQPVNTWKPL